MSDWIKRFLAPFRPDEGHKRPEPGLYAYRREREGEKARLHLRIDADGQGLLMVNANRVFHLNPTAAHLAYLYLEGVSTAEAEAALVRQYEVSLAQAQADVAQLNAQMGELTRPDGACPVCELELETTLPFAARPSAPYRMDLALTYRCQNDCAHCYNARERSYPELAAADWKLILDKLWQQGIPHVVFTGGEPTLRPDLPELVAHAEGLGMITGLNTNGRRLADAAYLQSLTAAGLDHVQITLESHDAAVHDGMVCARGAWEQTVDGVKQALVSPLYVMTNTTLLQPNGSRLAETLDFLAELGVPTVGLNALIYSGRGLNIHNAISERDLPPLLETAREKTAARGQRLIWYTPTRYCHFDPEQMELGVKGCTAALYNMCIEPDGAVIPCQSYYQPLGKMLSDPWQAIWNHPLAVRLRERSNLPAECLTCAFVSECGGGCPLARQALQVDPLNEVTR